MKGQDEKLSTADLARASERDRQRLDEIDIRGHEDERIRGTAAVADRPAPPAESTMGHTPAPAASPGKAASAPPAERIALFGDKDAADLRKRWSDIQTGFVDEPRRAVEHADSLVADVMKRLAEGFASERAQLEKQWDRGDNITTEDLRVALQRYRSFFDRLLAA
jgi:hypothetical protein